MLGFIKNSMKNVY